MVFLKLNHLSDGLTNGWWPDSNVDGNSPNIMNIECNVGSVTWIWHRTKYMWMGDNFWLSDNNTWVARIRTESVKEKFATLMTARGGGIKITFVNFSISKIFDLAKVPVWFFESHSYLTSVTAAQLRRHPSNINVIFRAAYPSAKLCVQIIRSVCIIWTSCVQFSYVVTTT